MNVTPGEFVQVLKNVYSGFSIISERVFQVNRNQLAANKGTIPPSLQSAGLDFPEGGFGFFQNLPSSFKVFHGKYLVTDAGFIKCYSKLSQRFF